MYVFRFRRHRMYADSSKSKTRAVSRPPVVAQDFAAAHLAFPKVLWNPAADLGESGAHYFAEVSLFGS